MADGLGDASPEVLVSSEQLRELVCARSAVAAEPELPAVLRGVVRTSRELVHARSAAPGSTGDDVAFDEFAHAGLGPTTIERIGQPPQGGGLLGPPGTDLVPLDAPIRIRKRVFGTPYLTRWLPAGPGDQILDVVLRYARDAAAADFATVALFVEPARLEVRAAVGPMAEHRTRLSGCIDKQVELRVDVATDLVLIEVISDGHTVESSTRTDMLTALRHSARTCAGTMRYFTPSTGGSHLVWTAHTPNGAGMASR